MTQVWLIDENGFYKNESIFVEEVVELMTTTPLLIGYVKPKLVNNEWIEGATEEEVKAWEDSQRIDICLSDKIQLLLTELEAYKHTYIEFIEYDGSQQRTQTGDRVMILDAQEGLEKGILTEVAWKYPDRYVLIKDSTYFLNMRMAIGMAIEKSYNTEYVLVQEINTLTEETVDSYDMKARFDTVFKSM